MREPLSHRMIVCREGMLMYPETMLTTIIDMLMYPEKMLTTIMDMLMYPEKMRMSIIVENHEYTLCYESMYTYFPHVIHILKYARNTQEFKKAGRVAEYNRMLPWIQAMGSEIKEFPKQDEEGATAQASPAAQPRPPSGAQNGEEGHDGQTGTQSQLQKQTIVAAEQRRLPPSYDEGSSAGAHTAPGM
jgi:hypothetical protein